ncbi:hypothetical protein CJU90_4810 [Yarrowia sp. C11]|nr:hypothetical protein CJU90_4810 [Yarrowia sp. C11]KAG5364627.1 hypothetical protein CKK34_3442 [Yarrowia sp. E02]
MSNKPFSLKPLDSADSSPTYNNLVSSVASTFPYYQFGNEPSKVESIDPKLQEQLPEDEMVVEQDHLHHQNQHHHFHQSEPVQDIPTHDPYAAYSFRYVHPPSINYHHNWQTSNPLNMTALLNPAAVAGQALPEDCDSAMDIDPSYFNSINPSMLFASSANHMSQHYTTMAHYSSLSPASPTSVMSNIPSCLSTPPEEHKRDYEDPLLTFTTAGFKIPDDRFDYNPVLLLENVAMAQSHLARDFELITYDTEETRHEFLRRCGNPYANLSAQAPIPEAEYCSQLNPGKGGRLTVYEPMYKSYISTKVLEDYFLNGTVIKPRPGNPKCLSKVDIHGQCRYCGEFLVMRNHSYSSHMYSKHGISATTNNVLPLPSRVSSTENKRGGIKLQGYCAICRTNVDLNERAKENEWISWFYHQQAHNVVERKQ